MGLYNIVQGSIICPRCHQPCEVDIETRLGHMDLSVLRIGDRYPFSAKPAAKPGRPLQKLPEHGNAIGDGYAVCPRCHRDFFVNVIVEAEIIQRIDVNTACSGYIPDIAH